MATKRCAPSETDYSTLSVFSYRSRVVARSLPLAQLPVAAHVIIYSLFGPLKDSMFSFSLVDSGCCFLLDESYAETFDAIVGSFVKSGSQIYTCLYIHECSTSRRGSEVAGTLSTLTAQLAQNALPVLSMTTIARNFLLVHEQHATKALSILQSIIEKKTRKSDPQAASSDNSGLPPCAELRTPQLVVLPPSICICTLALKELHVCAHALIWMLQLKPGKYLTHVFEMGGEVSLMFESESLDELAMHHPESAAALLAAAGTTLERDWRAVRMNE